MSFQVLRVVLLAWCCEAMLARWTSDRQAPLDLAVSLIGLGLIAVVPDLLSKRCGGRLRGLLEGLAMAAPTVLVVTGILAGAAVGVAPVWGPRVVVLLAVVLLVAAGFLCGSRGRSRCLGGWTVPAAVLAASLLAWQFEMDRLPPVGTLLPLVLMWAAAGACAGGSLSSRGARMPRLGAALLLVGGAGFASLPDRDVAMDWSDALPVASADAPDVVLLCVDTLRADVGQELRAYRRLAAEGTEFRSVQAAGPWTLPSMGTLMTGVPPWSHGAGSGENWATAGLPTEDLKTLAEQAAANGYDTAALVHNPVLSPGLGFRRGFRVWDSASVRTAWALPHTRSTLEARPFLAHLLTEVGLLGRRPLQDAAELGARAERVLEARRADRPLLLWVHFLDCHFPFRLAGELDGADFGQRMLLERGDAERFRADPWWSSPDGVALLKSAYRHELEAVDTALLGILAALGPAPERGRIVVLCSDHGEEFFEHGDVEHGHALYQELLSVPLVIAGLAGRAPGSVEEQVVTHHDLAATLFDAVGSAPAEEPHGRLLGGALEPRPAVSENLLYPRPIEGDADGAMTPWDSEWAVRDGRWKYIFGPRGALEIYDLDADPDEREDLSEELREQADAIPLRPNRVERKSAIGGAGMNRALNALGYTD